MHQARGEQKLIVFTAVEKFGPAEKSWDKYIQWSKLTHLTEVVSLDGCLCPNAIKELAAEDWQHNVQENFKTSLFVDLDYLLSRVQGRQNLNILAVAHEPEVEGSELFADARFEFCGYDLTELETGISALTNCGGFDLAFRASELSNLGLLKTLSQAGRVKSLLREHYPKESHAQCDLWAIWRMGCQQ
jgi:hypothetical protein